MAIKVRMLWLKFEASGICQGSDITHFSQSVNNITGNILRFLMFSNTGFVVPYNKKNSVVYSSTDHTICHQNGSLLTEELMDMS